MFVFVVCIFILSQLYFVNLCFVTKAELHFFLVVLCLTTTTGECLDDVWGLYGGCLDGVCLDHPIPQGFSSLLLKPYIKGVTHFQEV